MSRVRNVCGTVTETTKGSSSYYAKEDIVYNSQKKITFTADKGVQHGKPENPPKTSKFIIKGYWTDSKDKKIKEAYVGDTVRFHIETQDIPDGGEITFTIYDYDGWLKPDKLKIVLASTGAEYAKAIVKKNKAVLEFSLGLSTQELIVDEEDEVELYVKCSYGGQIASLPEETSEYLLVNEKEVKVTVIVELPHSKESGWGAKGLAGHSAMAVGDRYFDYGPNNAPGDYSESAYDYDFNEDGDKADTVTIARPDFYKAPGTSWWGAHIASKKGINPTDVTLSMALEHIKLHWNRDGTYIYGKVHTIEFYVKGSQADKMLQWWIYKYAHLQVYSVKPWVGDQCTTAVKSAIHEAFPFEYLGSNKNYISDDTLKPSGLLKELEKFVSTSKQHKGSAAVITVIKQESADWTP